MRTRVRSLASLSGLRIWHCLELWCRSQMWLRSCVAVALVQAGGYSSNQTTRLGTSICLGVALEKAKIKKIKISKRENEHPSQHCGDQNPPSQESQQKSSPNKWLSNRFESNGRWAPEHLINFTEVGFLGPWFSHCGPWTGSLIVREAGWLAPPRPAE